MDNFVLSPNLSSLHRDFVASFGTVLCLVSYIELSPHILSAASNYPMHPVATPPVALRDESDSLPPPLLLAYILFFFYCTDFQQLHSAPMFISHSSFTTLHLFTAHCHRLATLVPVRLVNVAISLHPVDSYHRSVPRRPTVSPVVPYIFFP